MSKLVSRLYTGIVMVIFGFVVIFSERRLLLFINIWLLSTLAIIEVSNCISPKKNKYNNITLLIFNSILNITGYFGSINAFMGALAFLIMLFFIGIMLDKDKKIREPINILFALTYVSFLFCFSYFYPDNRQSYLFIALLVSWGTDSFAYIIGSMFGKRHFSTVSPNKTLEGSIGGLIGSVLLCLLAGFHFPELNKEFLLLVGFVGSVFSQLGDLFASYLKRRHNLKDFSRLLNAHGGIMDRFDSVIFAIPTVWCFLKLFNF